MPRSTPAVPAALPLANCYWALPGKLLAGEHPGGSDPAASGARLRRLLDFGVRCFIDLTEPDELPAYDAALPGSVDYFRRPIPDHGVPRRPEEMAALLDCLHGALEPGGIVYLHCRAGIGRTGMTVACLLTERGLTAEQALGELNRRWQACPRAASWPSVPETPEQIEYVRGWSRRGNSPDPLLDPATLGAARVLRERFLGTLLGLAAGDAVAAATQYRRPGKFAPVRDMLGGGPFDLPRGAWSDDTAMALCLAESLLGRERFDARDQRERYRRWQQAGHLSSTGQCVGITAGTARALAQAPGRAAAAPAREEAPDPEALSRVAPVVMYFFATPEVAVEQAAAAAEVTCRTPAVLLACRALGRALHAALAGGAKSVILAQALTEAPPAGAAGEGGHGAPAALAAALDCFAGSGNFRDAVLAAANRGGDSDVVAAVCGALAGAHYGAPAIPTLWRDSLLERALIESFADRLLARALLDLGG